MQKEELMNIGRKIGGGGKKSEGELDEGAGHRHRHAQNNSIEGFSP